MPPSSLRVVDTGPGAPAFNMALDDALLRAGGAPTLRLYAWSPPGLSLGWFQPAEPFFAVPGPHAIVRRRTGGGAIYHDAEITFALTLDADRLPGAIAASYDLVHGAVQRALASVGVVTDLVPGDTGCGQRARPAALWCFSVPGPHDLVVRASGRKIVGSAQRRLRAPRARVLHHGSIVLRAPAALPDCGAVADAVDPDHAAPALRRALVHELAAALDLAPAPAAALGAEELQLALATVAEFAPIARTSRRDQPLAQ